VTRRVDLHLPEAALQRAGPASMPPTQAAFMGALSPAQPAGAQRFRSLAQLGLKMLPAETSDADRCSQSRTPKKRREEAFLRDVEISPWAVHESVTGRYCCRSRPIICPRPANPRASATNHRRHERRSHGSCASRPGRFSSQARHARPLISRPRTTVTRSPAHLRQSFPGVLRGTCRTPFQ
jgi:hypothetical protein